MITVYKNNIRRQIKSSDLNQYKDAGWTTLEEKAGEDIIRLKPPVKPKATVRVLEEANITNKGDE